MLSESKEKQLEISYSPLTKARATRALICSPFRLYLFLNMIKISVPLPQIVLNLGVNNHYTRKAISEGVVERELMWLIKVGILRREVDGQGITDSFRLTPLGRQIIAQWTEELPNPSWGDRFLNLLSRWLTII
ncbi:MAG: hypothetical protein EA365_02875 [Gloeocapsa sp. DLM2.Bin57]|nr:MAG: hypothetical protein EA365_02875 [Gloeocapsa sp. DLM2.Bin57]